jgi:hypothetical protein
MQNQVPPSVQQRELMDAVGFTLKGLEANRAGVLSESQQAQFKETSTKASRFAAAWGGAGVAIWVIFGPLALIFQAPPLLLWIIVGFSGLFWLPALGVWLRSKLLHAISQGEGQVESETGNLELVNHIDQNGSIVHEYWVGGYNINRGIVGYNNNRVIISSHPAPRRALRAFKEGNRYTIYYEARTRTLLSAERLGEE